MRGTSHRPVYDEDPERRRQQRIERDRVRAQKWARFDAKNGREAPPLHPRQVDSWRSYRDDNNSLQSTLTTAPSLDPSVRSFDPCPQRSNPPVQTPSYQQLRSTGHLQKQIAQHGIQALTGIANSTHPRSGWGVFPTPTAQPAQQYSTSANTPLPSVEPASRAAAVPWRTLPLRPLEFRDTPNRAATVSPPAAPRINDAYLNQARQPPIRAATAKSLLVILDLNGTLLHRPNRKNPTKFHLRPGVTPFLEYLFANHHVMIYSSARPENVKAMIDSFLLPKQRKKLTAVWARDKLGLTMKQFHNKVQVYKQLDPIWTAKDIRSRTGQLGVKWDQTNTVLVDDSVLKAAAQPHNIVLVPEFIYNPPKDDKKLMAEWIQTELDILLDLRSKLEELRGYDDVSQIIHQWQAKTVQGVDNVAEIKAKEATSRLEAGTSTRTPTQLMTPKSLVIEISSDEDDDQDEFDSDQLVTLTQGMNVSDKRRPAQHVNERGEGGLIKTQKNVSTAEEEDLTAPSWYTKRSQSDEETGGVPLTPESWQDNEV